MLLASPYPALLPREGEVTSVDWWDFWWGHWAHRARPSLASLPLEGKFPAWLCVVSLSCQALPGHHVPWQKSVLFWNVGHRLPTDGYAMSLYRFRQSSPKQCCLRQTRGRENSGRWGTSVFLFFFCEIIIFIFLLLEMSTLRFNGYHPQDLRPAHSSADSK